MHQGSARSSKRLCASKACEITRTFAIYTSAWSSYLPVFPDKKANSSKTCAQKLIIILCYIQTNCTFWCIVLVCFRCLWQSIIPSHITLNSIICTSSLFVHITHDLYILVLANQTDSIRLWDSMTKTKCRCHQQMTDHCMCVCVCVYMCAHACLRARAQINCKTPVGL